MTLSPICNLHDLPTAEALWRLGLLRADQLPSVGISLLSAGVDSSALRMLAATDAIQLDEGVQLFESMLSAMGRAPMSKRDAALIFARWISSKLLANDISPIEAAAVISDASVRVDDAAFHDLDVFVYASSEFQDRPEDTEMFSRAVRGEALRLLHETAIGDDGAR